MKLKNNICLFFAVFLFFVVVSSVEASPFIAGFVNNSYYGNPADGKIAFLWNSQNISNNNSDIIGTSGNSGANNFYMIDCALFNQPCNVGDVLYLQIVNGSFGKQTKVINITISGSGFELMENLRINSAPNVSLIAPVNYANITQAINFSCFASDPDGNLANITLYTNFTGNWLANETKNITGSSNSTTFSKTPSDGTYLWNCLATDDLYQSNTSLQNRTVIFDSIMPIIESITVNESYVCGLGSYVRVNCTTYDEFSGIYNVTIVASSNVSSLNYSTVYFGNDIYYSDVLLDQYGNWNFTCISQDYPLNSNNLLYSGVELLENVVELFIDYFSIFFSNSAPIEDEQIHINVTVSNQGCIDANNTLVSFYEGDPELGGINIANSTGSIVKGSSLNFSTLWNSKIGRTNIFAFADSNLTFSEINETNNKVNKTIDVVSWHLFYGNVTADRVLADPSVFNVTLWFNDTNSSGNVYVADTESVINWGSLKAFGRNTSNQLTSNDFSELDGFLNSGGYFDSISNIYTSDGNNPRNTTSFFVGKNNITNVPFINTTSSYNFISGILWDSFDDSDGEYGGADKEDVVFITQIKRQNVGSNGIYDYELRVPSKLREYDNLESSEVFIYFDLN